MRLPTLAILLTSLPLSAATYYVDFVAGVNTNNGTSTSTPWKHAKGMTGCSSTCSSTTVSAGDTVIFKGGTTWTSAAFPWTFPAGSSGGGHVTHTVDEAWYTGGSFTKPIFDAGGASVNTTGMANLTSAGYVTLNKLQFQNCGTSGVGNNKKCLVFTDTSNITITNSVFITQAWISIFFVFSTSGTRSNFTWTGNDFSSTSGAVWFASAASGAIETDITYNFNTFHDFTSQIGDDVHGDGAWHGYVIPGTDNTQYMDNMSFIGNRFYGDFRRSFGATGAMTAFFFHEGGLQNFTIANNDMTFYPVQSSMFDGLIVLEGEGNTHSGPGLIANNSLLNDGTNAMSAALHITSGFQNLTVRNNIFSGMSYCQYIEDSTGAGSTGATYITNNNLLDCANDQNVWGASFQSYATWQAGGRDVNSVVNTPPGFVTEPTNLHLQSGSAARSAGANLTSLGITLLNSDRDSVSRPGGATAWDIGAYQFGASACSITTTALPNGIQNSAYSQTVAQADCSASTWTISAGTLPTGLTINSGTGAITGTPTGTGLSSFTVAYDTDTQALSITVDALAPPTGVTVTVAGRVSVSGRAR